MPKNKLKKHHDSKPALALKPTPERFLAALGSPLLFALKIIFWTALYIGNKVINVIFLFTYVCLKSADTILWASRILLLAINHSADRLLTKLHSLQLPSVALPPRPGINLSLPKTKRRYQLLPHKKNSPSWQIVLLPILNKFIRLHFPQPLFPFRQLAFIVALLVLAFLFSYLPYQAYLVLHDLPNPQVLATQSQPLTTKLYDRNGILLYEFYHNQNRTPVNIASLPPYIAQATIAIEDKNFYSHPGFDISGIARAAFANSNGEITQGGSTITQQLVRVSLLSNERTFTRKAREVILAFWTEHLFTKSQILSMYLNNIPYGGTAYGVEAASETLFAKHAKDLTLAQAALLAGLPSAPTSLSPFGSHPELAKARQAAVLDAMVAQGDISRFAAENAKKEPLVFASSQTEIKAPHFVMYVHDYLVSKYGPELVDQGGLQVLTSLDYPLYQQVQKQLQDGVKKQQYLNVGNGAVLVTNPKTGEILSMNGSLDFFDQTHDGNVNVTTANRSPGSSIKPLNYALAFERGLLTPSTILDDSPITYRPIGSPPYSPTNYDNRFHGKIPARVALASSYNVPAVKVLDKNGLINFIQFATNAGITTFSDPSRFGLSLTLGGGEVKMTDMATAYSMFANQGKKVPINPILQLKDVKGNLLEDSSSHQQQATSNQLVSPKTAFLISNILSDDSARAPTFGAGSVLNIPGHTVSVKTGTTETKRDNWTIGYSFGPNPRLVAVWVGNNDNSPMSPYLESGNTGAAAIWHPIMDSLLKNSPNYPVPKPEDLIEVKVCALTGTLPCDNCPYISTEYFTRGTEPKTACSISKEDLDKFRNFQKTSH